MKTKDIIKRSRELAKPFRISKGKDFRLKDVDPDDTLQFTKEADKPRAKEALATGVAALAELQDKLYAQDKWAVLLIFQALDAAGKDGAIKHVMSGVNPQGCEVYSFQQRRAVVRRARRQQVVHAGDRGVCDHRYARVARVAVPQGEQGEEEGTGRREAHAAAFRLIMVAPATNCPGL